MKLTSLLASLLIAAPFLPQTICAKKDETLEKLLDALIKDFMKEPSDTTRTTTTSHESDQVDERGRHISIDFTGFSFGDVSMVIEKHPDTSLLRVTAYKQTEQTKENLSSPHYLTLHSEIQKTRVFQVDNEYAIEKLEAIWKNHTYHIYIPRRHQTSINNKPLHTSAMLSLEGQDPDQEMTLSVEMDE